MSNINLSNPQVLSNLIKAKIREGKGKYFTRDKVMCFRDEDGSEYLVPKELVETLTPKDFKEEKVKKEEKAKEEKPKAKTKK